MAEEVAVEEEDASGDAAGGASVEAATGAAVSSERPTAIRVLLWVETLLARGILAGTKAWLPERRCRFVHRIEK